MRPLRRLIRSLLALTICLISVPQKLNSHGGDPDLIHACINDKGIVRIVRPKDECARSETARHWIRVRPGEKPRRDRNVSDGKLASVELLDLAVGLAYTRRGLAESKLLFAEPSRSLPLPSD